MTRFVLRRLASVLPSVLGISLITFVVLNLSMGFPSPSGVATSRAVLRSAPHDDRSRYPDRHLPLFFNLSISDARSHANRELINLGNEETAERAKRVVALVGGAWLPYLLPKLPVISGDQKQNLLDALDPVAARIGRADEIAQAEDRALFWSRYWQIYRSDFKPVRAARLVRRVVRRQDTLALAELRNLDTFALPQLIAALDPRMPEDALIRILSIIGRLTDIDDILEPGASSAAKTSVVARWQGWWSNRYDRFTVFDRVSQITGTITETRYFRWLARLVTLDFGVSTRDGRPILEKMRERLPVTMLLSFLGLLFAYAIAIPLGIISAVRRGGMLDRFVMLLVYVMYSFPTFWLAMWLIRFFGSGDQLSLFPSQGLTSALSENWPLWRRLIDMAHHLVLPVICLSSVSIAILTRYQRVGMIQVINLDFMRAARAKGLSRRRAILKHGLRNGIVPVVTMLGLQIPYLVSGSVVVERIFGIPGIGHETFDAILAQDQPWLLAVVTVTAFMTMLGVIAADTIYALIDPRMAPGFTGERQ